MQSFFTCFRVFYTKLLNENKSEVTTDFIGRKRINIYHMTT